MQGIIVHPTFCCGSTEILGRLVEYQGKVPVDRLIRCVHCKTLQKTTDLIFILLGNKSFVIKPQRVKWFNDDLDLEQEETSKEKEDVTI